MINRRENQKKERRGRGRSISGNEKIKVEKRKK